MQCISADSNLDMLPPTPSTMQVHGEIGMEVQAAGNDEFHAELHIVNSQWHVKSRWQE